MSRNNRDIAGKFRKGATCRHAFSSISVLDERGGSDSVAVVASLMVSLGGDATSTDDLAGWNGRRYFEGGVLRSPCNNLDG